jgi:S-adenosyl-l-methionine hydroxide adenosyltransferase
MAPFHCLTVLTDYGLEDAFVAVCHEVADQIAPDLRIIDITHRIPPGDIQRGAAVLAQAVSGGDAARRLGLGAGTKVSLTARGGER